MTDLDDVDSGWPELANTKPDNWLVCIGPALWICGMLVWTFTIAGELTTAGFVGEGVAAVFVFVTTIATAIVAVRRALAATPAIKARTGFTVLGTLGLTVLFIAGLAFPLQAVHTGSDIGITLLLLLIGALAAWFGRRMTGPAHHPLPAPFTASLLAAAIVLSIGTVVHVLAVN